jgi:trk system potassium uptake protein TrkA
MKVIVVGGGKVGFYLSQTLMAHGHHPSIVEEDKNACRRIANLLDIPVICGDGSSLDTLENAGAKEADALVCVTGEDEDNLVICQLAKQYFHVPRTVARVNNPRNAEVMRRFGVDIPVSSTDSIARLIEREVDSAAIRQLMSLNRGEASLVELQLPQDYALSGKSLSELSLPQDSIVVSLTRNGGLIIPRGNTRLLSGDKLIVLCADEAIHRLSHSLKLEG